MNTDRIVASLAYLNMKKDFLMTGFRVVEITALVASAFGCRPNSTISTMPEKNDNNSSEFNPTETSEVAKITTGELKVVKDIETKNQLISSLPANKPEAQGDLDVFTIKVGDKDVPVIMYPILTDTYVKSISPTGTENNTLQSVATYTEFVDATGTKSWVRLTAVNPDPNVPATVWMYDPKGLPGPDEAVDMSRAVLGYSFDKTQDKAVGIKFQPLFIQPNYIAGYDYTQPVDVYIVGDIPAGMKVQARLVEPESPTASYVKMEAEYIATLTPEQMALYEQYGSRDRTSEGLVRRFLEHDGLKTYLAYVDVKPDSKDLNEVVAVWNPEQQKSNTALLIENNLFVNESSASEIIWNPDMDRAEAKQTMSDYMKYVRLKLVAEANGIELPNTLEGALGNEDAIELLNKGAQVKLNRASLSGTDHNYAIPEQTLNVSEQTGIVIKFVSEPNDYMFLRGRTEGLLGISFNQNDNSLLAINYMDTGVSYLSQFSDLKKYIYAARISEIFSHALARIQSPSADFIVDTVTETTIINNKDVSSFKPLVIFSSIR